MSSSRIIMAAVALVGMMACNPRPDGGAQPEEDASASLAGTEWVLQTFGQEGAEESAAPSVITIVFGADSTFAGSAGCNRYFGRFVAPGGDSVALGEAGSTRMACPEPAMTQEYRYLQALSDAGRYRIAADELVLSDGSVQLLRFARGPAGE